MPRPHNHTPLAVVAFFLLQFIMASVFCPCVAGGTCYSCIRLKKKLLWSDSMFSSCNFKLWVCWTNACLWPVQSSGPCANKTDWCHHPVSSHQVRSSLAPQLICFFFVLFFTNACCWTTWSPYSRPVALWVFQLL